MWYDELTTEGLISCGNKIHKTTHGETKTRLYRIWRGMKSRCYNRKFKPYPRYDGRGITICDEWRNSYESFREWTLSHGYADNLTLDRIDNDGNFEPSNCRWVTNKVQSNNTSQCMKILYNGEVKSLREWCDFLSLNYKTVKSRLYYGKSVSETLGIYAILLNNK